MNLIENWARAWRMLSVQLMALAGVLQVVWVELPPDAKATLLEHLHPDAVHWITAALAVAGILGRLVKQPKLHE